MIFNASRGGDYTLWKVPLQGGVPEQLTDYGASFPSVSPDGKWIAFYGYTQPHLNKIGVIPVTGGQPTQSFDYTTPWSVGYPIIHWARDGRSLAYTRDQQGASNIWAQPLDGGPPKQLTDFRSDEIFNFAWSNDGQRLVLARGSQTNDVVLIRDVQKE